MFLLSNLIVTFTFFIFSLTSSCGESDKNLNSLEKIPSEKPINDIVVRPPSSQPKERLFYQPYQEEIEVYELLTNHLKELSKTEKVYLSECRCLDQLTRNLNKIDLTSRYQLDRHVTNFMSKNYPNDQTLNLVFFGSGTLLNELTIVSKLSQAGYDLNIHLLDPFYFLYDAEDAVEKFKFYRNDMSQLPSEQLVYDYYWKEITLDKMLGAYARHHIALRQFRHIMGKVS